MRTIAEPTAGANRVINDTELSAVDGYDVSDYVRIEVVLGSGATAWAYVVAE